MNEQLHPQEVDQESLPPPKHRLLGRLVRRVALTGTCDMTALGSHTDSGKPLSIQDLEAAAIADLRLVKTPLDNQASRDSLKRLLDAVVDDELREQHEAEARAKQDAVQYTHEIGVFANAPCSIWRPPTSEKARQIAWKISTEMDDQFVKRLELLD